MLSQRAVVPFAIALAALAFAATPGGAPAAATCPQGVLDPVKGQAPYRDFLNRNWTGDGSVTGNPLECKSTLGPRTLLTSASLTDSTYYVEDNLTIATGETLTLPAGKTIRDCPSSVGGELCNGYSTGTGDLIVDGTAEIDGSFLDYKGKGIVVDAGGTLKSTDGTFAKTTHSAGWNGIAFKAGSKGSLTGATISYADGGVSVAGASTKVTISGGTISNADGPCVSGDSGGNPTLTKVGLSSCNPVVKYTFVPPVLGDSELSAKDCSGCGVYVPGGTYPAVNWEDPGIPIVIPAGDVTIPDKAVMNVHLATVEFAGGAVYVDKGGTLNLRTATFTGTVSGGSGGWGGVAFLAGSHGTLIHASIDGAGAGLSDGTCSTACHAGVLISGASPTIKDTDVILNEGSGIEVRGGGTPTLAGVHFLSNTAYALQYDFPTDLTDGKGNRVVSSLKAETNGGTQPQPRFDSLRIFGAGGLAYSSSASLYDVGIPIILDGGGSGTTINGVTTRLSLLPGSRHVEFVGGDVSVQDDAQLSVKLRTVLFSQNAIYVDSGASLVASSGGFAGSLFGSNASYWGGTEKPGDWKGIAFLPGSSGEIDSSEIVDAGGQWLGSAGCGLHQAAILVCGASVSILDAEISKSAGDGIDVSASGKLGVLAVAFTGNAGWPILFDFMPESLGVSLVHGSGNGRNGIGIRVGDPLAGFFDLEDPGMTIDVLDPLELLGGSSFTVTGGSDPVVFEGNVQVDDGASANIGKRTVIPKKAIVDKGAVKTNGATVGGARPGKGPQSFADPAVPVASWNGIVADPGSTLSLVGTQIVGAGGALDQSDGCGFERAAVFVCKAKSFTMTSSSVRQSFADDLDVMDVAGGSLRYDSFYAVPTGFFALRNLDTATPFTARNEWWGVPAGPFNATVNREGSKSVPVSDGVVFAPWLTGLDILPPVGPGGTGATVYGRGFKPGELVSVNWDCGATACTSPVLLATAKADANGNFDLGVTVPVTTGGAHAVAGQGSVAFKTGSFTVTTTDAISPTSGAHGTQITVGGTGFGASESVTLQAQYTNTSGKPATVPLGSAATDAAGTFAAFQATIPADAKVGTKVKIVATGGTSADTATALFTVTP